MPAIGSVWQSGSWVDTRAWKEGAWVSGAWLEDSYVWESGVWEEGAWKSGAWETVSAWAVGGWEEGSWADVVTPEVTPPRAEVIRGPTGGWPGAIPYKEKKKLYTYSKDIYFIIGMKTEVWVALNKEISGELPGIEKGEIRKREVLGKEVIYGRTELPSVKGLFEKRDVRDKDILLFIDEDLWIVEGNN